MREIDFIPAYTFDDVNIVPRYSTINSRSDVDTTMYVTRNYKLSVPIIASPMDTIVGEEMMKTMRDCGGMAILPRFAPIGERVEIVKRVRGYMNSTCKKEGLNYDDILCVAIGVRGDVLSDAQRLLHAGANMILIDVAHGHSEYVKKTLSGLNRLKKMFDFEIIAGNVATGDGTADLIEWGADGIRCGIGGGCFIEGSLVNTGKKLVKIEDLPIGESVITHTGDTKSIIGKISYAIDEEICIINNLRCTKNHEIYVLNKKYEDIVNETTLSEYAEWVPARLVTSDYFLIDVSEEADIMKFKLVPVVEIGMESYTGKVYDLTVDKDESYNIDGIIVHNSRCSTRTSTGVGVPMVTSIMDCVDVAEVSGIPVIADGGMSTPGDVCKALGCGASAVMLGNMLAGTDECPVPIEIDNNGNRFKGYKGSASYDNKVSRGEFGNYVEGVSKSVAYKGPVVLVLNSITDGIKSACSYVGVKDLMNMSLATEFNTVTPSGIIEAGTHN